MKKSIWDSGVTIHIEGTGNTPNEALKDLETGFVGLFGDSVRAAEKTS